MTNIIKLPSEEMYTKNLKNSKSVEKLENPNLFKTLSNPDNKKNIDEGLIMAPLIVTNVVNLQIFTSTPKNEPKSNIYDNSTTGNSFGSNAMLDSGFYSHNGSSYLNSSNSSINRSYDSSDGIKKFDSTKQKESLTRSCKTRKSSPSSMSRNRLKAISKRQSIQSPRIQFKNETANISFNTSLSNNSSDVDKSSKTTPGSTLDELNASHYFSSSSTQTCKNLNQSTSESANESYLSLVNACGKVSLSSDSKTQSKSNYKISCWQDRVHSESFNKVICQLKPPQGVHLIGSKMALTHFDIVSNVFKQSIFDFTNRLLSYLSKDDLMSFHQVSKSWKRTLEWQSDFNKVRKDHVKGMHHWYVQNRENIVKKSRLSLPSTTAKKSPLQSIQKTSVGKESKRKHHFSQYDIFQQAASQLLNHQSLMKCPRCSYVSHVDGLKALCQKSACGLEFCCKCLRSDHSFGVICPQEITH